MRRRINSSPLFAPKKGDFRVVQDFTGKTSPLLPGHVWKIGHDQIECALQMVRANRRSRIEPGRSIQADRRFRAPAPVRRPRNRSADTVASGKCLARLRAMTPLPVPTSRILDFGPPEADRISDFRNSTSSSVSGRGTSARLSQRKVCPQNSTVPSKCWSGSPWPRRLTNSRSGASSDSVSLRSNSR